MSEVILERTKYDDGSVIARDVDPDGNPTWKGYWPNQHAVVRCHDVAGWQYCFPTKIALELKMANEGYGPMAKEAR
jgi:hypothetical protein